MEDYITTSGPGYPFRSWERVKSSPSRSWEGVKYPGRRNGHFLLSTFLWVPTPRASSTPRRGGNTLSLTASGPTGVPNTLGPAGPPTSLVEGNTSGRTPSRRVRGFGVGCTEGYGGLGKSSSTCRKGEWEEDGTRTVPLPH